MLRKYDAETRRKTQLVISVLEDISQLIGEFKTRPVKLSTGSTVVPGLGMLTDEIDLKRRVQDIRKGLFTIIVLGKFNHGKSTLINALLGKETVRARAIPTTAAITVISCGKNTDVAIYENRCPEPHYIPWDKFLKEYTLTSEDVDSKEEDRFAHIDYAQIETQHPLVTRGIKLVDSPGLGEDDPRTATTLRFLKQAQAVIFILDANHLLSLYERDFISRYLGQGLLEHVLFVINRINEVEDSEVSSLNDRLKNILSPHFSDNLGRFNETYYRKRVFFVDALTALQARTTNSIDNATLECSGILALEKQINNILESEDRFRAVIMSTVQVLSGILMEAHNQITRRKIAIQQPISELRTRKKEANIHLRNLEEQSREIREMLSSAGERLYLKASKNYRDYVLKMEDKWSGDAAKYLPLDDIELTDLLIGVFNDDAKSRVVSVIQKEVTDYVEKKLKKWSKTLWKFMEKDIQKIENDTFKRISIFQKQLNLTQDNFAAGHNIIKDRVNRLNSNLLTDSYYAREITGDTSEMGDMMGILLGELLLGVGIWIIAALINPVLLVAALIAALEGVSFVNPLRTVENFKKKIRNKIGEDIHTKLKANTKIEELIHERLGSHFNQFSESVGNLLDSHIKDAAHQMESVINELEKEDFSVANEMARLEKISEQLQELFKTLCVPGLGREYCLNELEKIK
jgi:GTPase Era involved in 16S rRNA processing